MKGAFRQSMGWLHTWGGLVAGWVLYFMFLTGTAGYFDVEIDRWMQPERPLPAGTAAPAAAVERGVGHLEAVAPGAERWFVRPPDHRSPDLFVFWSDPGASPATGREDLDAATGETIRHRDTGGGQLLYRMHYDLHYLPATTANWIAGIAAMAMLVAIVTGVIVHKRIFRDFFTFRPRKGQRSWLDAHNILGVAALPFHLMITWSGLVFFAYLYMAPVIWANYGFHEDARDSYFDELFDRNAVPEAAGTPAALLPLGPLLDQAEARMGLVEYVNIHHPGDANARIVVAGGAPNPSRARIELVFDGTTGALLDTSQPRSVPMVTYQTLLGLHEGLFAGPLLRWLYFLAGVMGTAMIGAGLVLWTAKRRAKIGGTFGFRLVERLNLGTIAGLPIAAAAYFWANRLIPVGIEGRAQWEAHAMFIAWAVMLAHAFLRQPARAWPEQLWIAAAASGLLPVLNALTTDRHLGVTLPAGVWDLAGFDLVMLAFGLAFACAASMVGHSRRTTRAARPASGQAPAASAAE